MDDSLNQYNKSINTFSSLSRRDILIRLGDAVLTQGTIGLSSPTVKQCLDAAKNYLTENYNQMKSLICQNKINIMSKENTAVASILDLLIAHFGGLPSVFASLYIADYTIDKFCESAEEDFIRGLDNG